MSSATRAMYSSCVTAFTHGATHFFDVRVQGRDAPDARDGRYLFLGARADRKRPQQEVEVSRIA